MSRLAGLAAELRGHGLNVREEAPFGAMTTYGTGGNAAVMVNAAGEQDLVVIGRTVAAHGSPDVFVLGNGSNTLVSDDGFDGVVVRLSASPADGEVFTVSNGVLATPASTKLPVLARRSVAAGWCGLEWAVGVPGTVGGAVRMNAGGHGAEIMDSLVDARVISLRTGESADINPADLGLHFRGSSLRDWHVVVSARFTVGAPAGHDCAAELASIVAWRREHQPGGRNAGSVFVNPAPGSGSSGALIDGCGLRGRCVGGASVSERHANFVQASDGASSRDIIDVMTAVQDEVLRQTGVRLRSETRLVGFDADTVSRFSQPYGTDAWTGNGRVSEMLGES